MKRNKNNYLSKVIYRGPILINKVFKDKEEYLNRYTNLKEKDNA